MNIVFEDRFDWDAIPLEIWSLLWGRRGHQSRFKLFTFFFSNGMSPSEIVDILWKSELVIPFKANDNSLYHYKSLASKAVKDWKYFARFAHYDVQLKSWIKGDYGR